MLIEFSSYVVSSQLLEGKSYTVSGPQCPHYLGQKLESTQQNPIHVSVTNYTKSSVSVQPSQAICSPTFTFHTQSLFSKLDYDPLLKDVFIAKGLLLQFLIKSFPSLLPTLLIHGCHLVQKKQWKYIFNDGGITHVFFFDLMKTFVSQDIIYASKKFWTGNYLHKIYYYNFASIKTIFTQSMPLSKYFQLKIKNC